VRAFLVRLYAYRFLDSFILILPFYAVMFADRGLTPTQIALVLICWSATTFVVQVPAGVVADRLPRRYVLAAAELALATCFAIWWAAPGFWGFLIGLIFWGLKSGFTGGTFEALLYDELKAEGRAADYPRIFGRSRAVQALAMILASLVAAAFARFGYGAALIASLASALAASAMAASLPPAARAFERAEHGYLAHLRQGLGVALASRTVISILAFSTLVLALGGALEEFWPIYGLKVGVSRSFIALFVAGQQALEAGGALVAHRFSRWRSAAFHALFLGCGALLALAAWLFTAPAMVLLALYSCGMRVLDVAYEGRLQHEIPSQNRATIGSVKGFTAQVGVSALYLALGPIAQAASYQVAFLACGLAGVGIGAVYLAASRRG
jgi:MFS family permease